MKTILIVDDEPHVALVLKQFLERAGLKVFSVLNGKLAMAFIVKERPDVVISDVKMPIMGGIELCETLQQDLPDYHPFIVLMISRVDRDVCHWLEQQDAIAMMEKPLSMRRLLARINAHFATIRE
jgi:DNA-binding response OmpR family regulator